MTPIRIGFVGLSKRGWGRTAHLPYLSKTSNYEIAALVNSSIESSKDAIKELGLSPDTKAYGSVAELAKDPSIDLIVVSVKAPDHYKTLKPAIEAGKNVFVEWPLGATLQQAEELAQLAKEKGIRSIVGAQGHLEPASRAVKKLIEGGSIGGVVSTEATLYPAGLSTTQAPQTNYLLSRESSGLLPLIYFPHWIQTFTGALGNISSLSGFMPTQYPIIDLVDTEGKVVEQGFRKTAPDHIYVHGRLKAGSVFAITLRGGEPINELGLVWTIHGEKGDIQVTSPKAPIWVGVDGVKITIKLLGEEEKAVPIETDEWSDLGQWKTNVARLYEEYRKGEAGSYMDFEQALKMHRLIDYMYKSSDSGQTVTIK